jgi:hypothetical protein
MLQRRGFIAGLASALAAPAIIRTSGLLMAIRPPIALPFSVTILDKHIASVTITNVGSGYTIHPAGALFDLAAVTSPTEFVLRRG